MLGFMIEGGILVNVVLENSSRTSSIGFFKKSSKDDREVLVVLNSFIRNMPRSFHSLRNVS